MFTIIIEAKKDGHTNVNIPSQSKLTMTHNQKHTLKLHDTLALYVTFCKFLQLP